MVLFVEGLIKGRSVQFIKVANHMSTKMTPGSLSKLRHFKLYLLSNQA